MRVLLVEDEASLRMTLAANLELEGVDVVEAGSAEQALQEVARQRFDIVLSDVRMPGMSGVALYQRLRVVAPDLPVVLMTAFAVEDQLRQALHEGVYTVLPKPFDVERIVPMLARASRRPAVLVLEPSADDAIGTADALRELGLRAEATTGLEAAVEIVLAGAVDVCIADIDHDDAPALVARLASASSEVAIVAIATVADPAALSRLAGAVKAFVTRPFAVPHLVEVVAKARRDLARSVA